MGRIGKDKKMIGITTPEDLTAIIDARAEALGWSRAKFALAVLQRWQEEGCNPVNKIDATMAPEVMAKLSPTKARKRAS